MDKSRPVISRNLREDAVLGNASGPLQAPFPGRLPEAMEDCGLPDCGVCEDFASLIRALVCREILPADITECHGGSDARVRGKIFVAEQTLIGRRPAIEGAVMALGGGRRHQNDGP
jgi:hypothetical protein